MAFLGRQSGLVSNIIKIGFGLLAVSFSVWMPYLNGFGGYEHLIVAGTYVVFITLVIAFSMFVMALWHFLIGLLRHHRFMEIIPFVFPVTVFCLTFCLPSLVAKTSRRLGALQRIERVGGELAYTQLLESCHHLLNESTSNIVSAEQLPEVFRRLGVTEIIIHKESNSYIDAITSGRPFPTGWIIFSNAHEGTTTKGVEVYPRLYRY